MINKLIAINSRDNRNVSSTLIRFFKHIGLAPKTHPSIAVDCAMIMQEIYYKHASECGEVIDGRRMVFCTAEQLGYVLPHLSLASISRRLTLLVEAGLIIAEKVKKSRCWHAMWYGFNTEFWRAETIDNIDFSRVKDRFLTDEKSESNNTPLSKPNKKKKDQERGKQEKTDQVDPDSERVNLPSVQKLEDSQKPELTNRKNKNSFERPELDCLSNPETLTINSNLDEDNNSRRVDFLINNWLLNHYVQTTVDLVAQAFEKAIAFCTPVLRKDMEHEPKLEKHEDTSPESHPGVRQRRSGSPHVVRFDRYFNGGNQQTEIRDRVKSFSALGHSAFKSIEQMQECQIALTKYYSKTLDPNQAVKEAYWTIKGEQEGKRCAFVADFLEGKMIGTWCKREWEVEPGTPVPVLLAYLRCKLRRDGDTHAQTINRVSWQLKDSQAMIQHWAECKRLIDIEKPRLEKAIQLGQNLIALKIPEWIIESFRPETPVEKVVDTAIALGEIASEYSKVTSNKEQVTSNQNLLLDTRYSLLKNQGAEQSPKVEQEEEIPVTIPGGVTLDFVKQLSAQEQPSNLSSEHEVDQLLSDPLTRLEGVKLARQRNLPVINNREGIAIAIDFNALDDKRKRQAVDEVMDKVTSSKEQLAEVEQTSYAPHTLFKAEEMPEVTTNFRNIAQLVKDALKKKNGAE